MIYKVEIAYSNILPEFGPGPMIFDTELCPLNLEKKMMQTKVKLSMTFEIVAACWGIHGIMTHLVFGCFGGFFFFFCIFDKQQSNSLQED